MCLTTPHKIKKVNGHKAELNDGRIVDISLLLMDKAGLPRRTPNAVRGKAGDWVLANADLAVSKITAAEAKEINNYLK